MLPIAAVEQVSFNPALLMITMSVVTGLFGAGGTWAVLNFRLKRLEDDHCALSLEYEKFQARVDAESRINGIAFERISVTLEGMGKTLSAIERKMESSPR